MSAHPWVKELQEHWRLQGHARPATDMFTRTGDALVRPNPECGADSPGRRADKNKERVCVRPNWRAECLDTPLRVGLNPPLEPGARNPTLRGASFTWPGAAAWNPGGGLAPAFAFLSTLSRQNSWHSEYARRQGWPTAE